jgi:hypothetical protein
MQPLLWVTSALLWTQAIAFVPAYPEGVRSGRKWWVSYPDPRKGLHSSPACDYDTVDVSITAWKDVRRQWPGPPPLPASAKTTETAAMSLAPHRVGQVAPAGFKDIGIVEGQKFECNTPSVLKEPRSTQKKRGDPYVPSRVLSSPEGFQGGSECWVSHYPGEVDTSGAMEPFCIVMKEGDTGY